MSKKKAKKKAAKKKAAPKVKKKEEPTKDMNEQPETTTESEALADNPVNTELPDKPIIEEAGLTHSDVDRTPGTMGKPSNLDPDLVKRALGLGFTQNQVNNYTENGALEAACDRCKPIATPPSPAKKKRIPVSPNAIPDGVKDHVLELKAVTPRREHDHGRNRAAFDEGVINSAMFQLIKDNRQKYKIYRRRVEINRIYEPDKAGNYITEIRMVVALEELNSN